MRLSPGCSANEMRLTSPRRKLGRCVSQGMAGSASSSTTSSPIADAGTDRQPRPLDAAGGQVLTDPARLDRVALDLQTLDDLDREEADGTRRPAMDGVLAVRVALEAEPADVRAGHGALGHAAIRDADLEHATGALHRRMICRSPRGRTGGCGRGQAKPFPEAGDRQTASGPFSGSGYAHLEGVHGDVDRTVGHARAGEGPDADGAWPRSACCPSWWSATCRGRHRPGPRLGS